MRQFAVFAAQFADFVVTLQDANGGDGVEANRRWGQKKS